MSGMEGGEGPLHSGRSSKPAPKDRCGTIYDTVVGAPMLEDVESHKELINQMLKGVFGLGRLISNPKVYKNLNIISDQDGEPFSPNGYQVEDLTSQEMDKLPETSNSLKLKPTAQTHYLGLKSRKMCNKTFTPFDDRDALVQALSTNPEYLKNRASDANMVVDYKDWQIPLGRRFRSLKLWMVLRLYGVENLQHYVRNHIKLAKQFEELVAQDPRFEVIAPRKFALVCFRLLPPHSNEDNINKLNHDLLDYVNSTGKVFISHTVLSGKYTIRFAVGAPLTEERHVSVAWKLIQEKASLLLSELGGMNGVS